MKEHNQDTQLVVYEQPAQLEQDQCRSNMIRHQPKRYEYLIIDQGNVCLMDQYDHMTYQEAIIGPEF